MDDKKQEIVTKFAENGMILTPHGLEKVLSNNLNLDDVLNVAKERNIWLISDEFLTEFVKGDEIGKKEKAINRVEWSREIFAKNIDSDLRIFEATDVTGKSTCEGKVDDFVEYFNEKYKNLKEILRDRENLRGAVPIEVIKKNRLREESQIIAMVTEKRGSKKGFRFLDVEDPSGELSVFIPRDNTVLNSIYDRILPDEVIGIYGRLSNNLFIASDIVEPELPMNHNPILTEEPIHIALTSDIHVGSYLFLEKEFKNFLDWLGLKGNKTELAEKVKYLFVAGDLVDGIGIYPGQEKELSIPDIYGQYDFLASLLENVPDYIEVILSMGNHDAVRLAEPQPKLANDIGGRLYDLPNVHIVGNPVMVSTHGVKTLIYHGTSLDTIISNLADCTYSRPEIGMIEYLRKRYLVPMYGKDSLSPESKDYLSIKEIPDILHSGHVHTNGYANYRGVRIINSGTWQARTKYQDEQGHMPTPGKVPLINLQNQELSVIHFVE